jgi:RNA polymerase sigma-70 factor (ECF subfamily)
MLGMRAHCTLAIVGSVSLELARAFLGNWKGQTPDPERQTALETSLRAAWERARTQWPTLTIVPGELAHWCGARAADDCDPATALARLHVGDLYVTCACARGHASAIQAFEDHWLAKVPIFVARLSLRPELVEETKQQLRERLFVAASGEQPKIAQFNGHGPLEGWLRVAAVRTALNLLQAEHSHATLEEDGRLVRNLLAVESDPELDYIKSEYRSEFKAAFREAVATLPQRDRNLLRFHFVEQLIPERIGAMYGVHRTTAMRWLDSAQATVLNETRRLLIERLQLSPSECDRLVELVRSRLQVTVSSLLRN